MKKIPDKFIEAVKAIAPTFGGINLEDIKAPECFEIERRLKEELDIPVMHDDQHGTAIISSAGLVNALQVAGKKIEDVKIVVNGAGASAVSCTKLYVSLGATPRKYRHAGLAKALSATTRHRPERNRNDILPPTARDIHTLEEAITGRRRIPRTFQRQRADTRYGAQHGGSPHRVRPCQPRTRKSLTKTLWKRVPTY